MNDKQINNIVSSGIVDTKGLDILDTRPSVGSISEPDEFTSVEMKQYLLYSQNIKESLMRSISRRNARPFLGKSYNVK